MFVHRHSPAILTKLDLFCREARSDFAKYSVPIKHIKVSGCNGLTVFISTQTRQEASRP